MNKLFRVYKRVIDLSFALGLFLVFLIFSIIYMPVVFAKTRGRPFLRIVYFGKKQRKFSVFFLKTKKLQKRKDAILNGDIQLDFLKSCPFVWFNIFVGNLTIVGQRPITVSYYEKNKKMIDTDYFNERPGVISYSQIISYDSDKAINIETEKDSFYLKNQTILSDIIIFYANFLRKVFHFDGEVDKTSVFFSKHIRSKMANWFIKFRYHRIAICFIVAFLTASIPIATIVILEYLKIGVSFETITNGHAYSISNPLTIVSFGATMVTVSLTLLGFFLNSFAKHHKIEGAKRNQVVSSYDVQGKTVEILLTRFRSNRKGWKIWNFPILCKAMILIYLSIFMFVTAFVGNFRIFYLGVTICLMFLVDLFIIFDVFSLYADRNYSLSKAASTANRIIISRLKRLCKSAESYYSDFSDSYVDNYSRMDIIYSCLYLFNSYTELRYCNDNIQSYFILKIKKKKIKYPMIEIAFACIQNPKFLASGKYQKAELANICKIGLETIKNLILNNQLIIQTKNGYIKIEDEIKEEINYLNSEKTSQKYQKVSKELINTMNSFVL